MSNPFGILENSDSIMAFLEDVTGQKNPRLMWTSPYPWVPKDPKKVREQFGSSTFQGALKWICGWNDWRRDVFFSVRPYIPAPDGYKNSKGRKVKRCPGLPRSFMIDVDCGTDAIDIKNARLNKCWDLAKELGIVPSYIVLSRNGFHFYWVIEDGLPECLWWDAEQNWREAQEKLILLFDSDIMVKGTKQNMRLPGSLHFKGQRDGFPVRFHRTDEPFPELRKFMRALKLYCPDDYMMSFFGEDPFKDPSVGLITNQTNFPSEFPSEKSNRRSEASKSSLPSFEKIKQSMAKVRQDQGLLEGYVGIHKNGFCPFHIDKTPSASIYQSRNGAWLFRCKSTRCAAGTMDILQAIKFKENLGGTNLLKRAFDLSDDHEAFDILSRPQGESSKIFRERLEYLDRNMALIKLIKTDPILSYNYPVKTWIIPFLENFFRWARRNIRNNEKTFPLALNKLAGSKHLGAMTTKLYLLRLVGLVEIAQIPEACKASQESFKKRNKVLNDTSWHFIPEWTEKSLKTALAALEEAYAVGFSTNKCDKAMVRKHLGEEGLLRVFHGETTSKKKPYLDLEDYEEEQRRLMAMTEEEFEQHILETGGEEALKKYRGWG